MTESADDERGELPPPSGPPAETPMADRSAPFWSGWDLPFGNAREAGEWWFGPLTDRRTWASLGYLAVGAIAAVFRFVAVVVLLAVSLPLVVVGVGLPLTALSLSAVDAMTSVERSRATWVGAPIPPRPFGPREGTVWQRMVTRLSDPARWRQVAFVMASLVVQPVLLALGALPLVVLIQSAFRFSVGGIIIAVLVVGLVGRSAVFVAGLAHSYAGWFLGPDRTAELEARVDTLSGQRDDILEAVSAERRRIERNLHDGVQQQLVAIGIDIGRAQARLAADPDGASELLDDARNKVRGSVGELRMIGRGLHPAVLDDRGLDAALSAIVASAPIPIAVQVDLADPVPRDVAETAYYVANEAVANVLKHANARAASIRVAELRQPFPAVSLTVHDDGRGGASSSGGGSGLAGMAARVRGVDGWFSVDSPVGGPTVITALIPRREGDGG